MITSASGERALAFPYSTVLVTPWPDPVLDHLGHDPRSRYAEQFWLAVLGPSAMFLLRRIAANLERNPDGFEFSTAEWATELGIGIKGGRHSPFWRALDRTCRFRLARRRENQLLVYRRMPPLTQHQVGKLPQHLGAAHKQWEAERLSRPVRSTVAKWSPERVKGPNPETVETHNDEVA